MFSLPNLLKNLREKIKPEKVIVEEYKGKNRVCAWCEGNGATCKWHGIYLHKICKRHYKREIKKAMG